MLRIENLTLRRGAKLLFEQANLQVHGGQKVGVTGANGSGKTSLFSLILGDLHADSGDCRVPPRWTIAHVAQETHADTRAALDFVLEGDAELTLIGERLARAEKAGYGHALAGLHSQFDDAGGYAATSRAGQLLHGLGFANGDGRRPVAEFSGGWRVRLNLARALMCRSDLLLLDEPTNHLDLDMVIWLEDWLRAYPGTLLLISHDREFLDSVVTHVLHINHQRVGFYPGNYSAFERVRTEQLATQQAAYRKQQREIAHMREFVERFRAKATKARQAQSRLKALERMALIAPAHVDAPFDFALRQPARLPMPLLRLQQCDAGYGEDDVLTDVTLSLSPGDRIGLLGRNGAGKSTLVKLLAGALLPRCGRRLAAQYLGVGYFAQHQVEQLDPQASPLQHLARLHPGAREQSLRDHLGGFGFSNEQALSACGTFSGGEKSSLALALLIYQAPNLLLLDEPTNHLDLEMRQALAVALQDFDGAMVLVSHDRHLLRVCCDRLMLVHEGKATDFAGGLDGYPEWLRAQERGQPAEQSGTTLAHGAAARKQRKREQAVRRQQTQPLREKIVTLEEQLDRLHSRQRDLESDLAAPEVYQPNAKDELKTLLKEKAATDQRARMLEEEWLAASERLEALLKAD
jgi:ATP-binding cassette subfamily F protein 3